MKGRSNRSAIEPMAPTADGENGGDCLDRNLVFLRRAAGAPR